MPPPIFRVGGFDCGLESSGPAGLGLSHLHGFTVRGFEDSERAKHTMRDTHAATCVSIVDMFECHGNGVSVRRRNALIPA